MPAIEETSPLLQVCSVAKRYGPVWALRDVELALSRGESVALVGPNGAGKSTLLRILAGVARPTQGSVRWSPAFGEPSDHAEFRQRIGFVGHRSFLYPTLSVRENLLFYASLYRLPEARGRIEEFLRRFQLVNVQNRAVGNLSRGLEQRAALARALLHDPVLLLLDEPFTGLDVEASATLSAVLKEEQMRGVTLVLATHDFGQAEALCQRVLLLVGGRVARDVPMPRSLSRLYDEVVCK